MRLSPLVFIPVLWLLCACGSGVKADPDDSGGAPDSGGDGGVAGDGGALDGGSTDGGSSDGGTSDGGTSDSGSSDGGDGDGGAPADTGPFEGEVLDVASAELRFTGEADGDQAGDSVAMADLAGDGVPELVVGAPGANAVYLLDSSLRGDVVLADAGTILRLPDTEEGKFFGGSVAAGVLDGQAMVAVGCFQCAPFDHWKFHGAASGAVYVYDDVVDGAGGSDLVASAVIEGAYAWEEAVGSVATVLDLSGDGVLDVAITGSIQRSASPDVGGIFVFYGPLSGRGTISEMVDLTLDSENSRVSSFGDVDGDGVTDVVIGGGSGIVVHLGPLVSDRSYGDADGLWLDEDSSWIGSWAVELADMDGDGLDDVLFDDYLADGYAGAVYLMSGPATGSGVAQAQAVAKIEGRPGTEWDVFGRTLATPDADQDGQADLVAQSNAPYYGNRGAAWVILDIPDGVSAVFDVASRVLAPSSSDDYLAWAVGSGDTNGDGWEDLFVTGAAISSVGQAGGGYLFLTPNW